MRQSVHCVGCLLLLAGISDLFGEDVSVGPVSPAAENSVVLPFETLNAKWGSGRNCEKGEQVIREAQAWDELWNKRGSTMLPKPKPPAIDFDQHMVIAVCMGSRPTGGHSIKVEKVVETEKKLKVYVKQKTPPPWGAVTQAFTCPRHVIKLAKRDKEICFQIATLKHSARTPRKPEDSRIDPDIYQEFDYSADGKARVIVALKQSRHLDGMPAAEITGNVLEKLAPGEFDVKYRYKTFAGLAGRINASGLAKLAEHPYVVRVDFEEPFSAPEQYVIEKDCELNAE